MAHLTLVLQGREVRKFVLNPGVTTIGRAQDNDIVINNLALSRRHAQVEKKGSRYEVSDLASQNGVFVNSERVRVPRTLENADTITLGTYHFVFNDSSTSEPDVRAVAAAVPKRAAGEVTELGDPVKPEPVKEREKEPDVEHAPLLVLKYNDVELQRFPLRGTSCLVGRAKDCQVQIAERRLSRKHCEIVRNEGDRWFVKDLGSQNGTYVNRKRIRDFHNLQHGDVLNFAEYAVLYLSDGAAYDGPDLVHARRQAAQEGRAGKPGLPGPRPGSEIGVEETDFPEAYSEGSSFDMANAPSVVPEGEPLHPSEPDEDPSVLRPQRAPVAMRPGGEVRPSPHPSDGEDGEPLTEDPGRSRERRKNMRRAPRQELEPTPPPSRPPSDRPRPRPSADNNHAHQKRPAPAGSTDPNARRVLKKQPVREADARERREMIEDIPDDLGDVRPDSSLEDWYKSRDEKSEVYEEESSSVLLRSKSSVSKVLSTMMVDKKELDRNLSVKARQRKFFVEVTRGSEKVYSGPLTQPVTILGTDREADIQLKGRYVAGRHSILVRVRDSLLLVRLGSSSAARVNGLPKLQAFLKTGDVIQIDETTIKILED